ncbi:MAG: hypothetical protein ACLR23_26500 [Clostridia bacterium]
MVITSNTELGSAYEEVPLQLEGEGLTIAFNPKYYLEALRVIEEEEVCILYSSSLTTLHYSRSRKRRLSVFYSSHSPSCIIMHT